MSEPTMTPRETARQIAEQVIADLHTEISFGSSRQWAIGMVTDAIEQHVAALTAALAQARQRIAEIIDGHKWFEQERRELQDKLSEALDAKVVAEQARDEAHNRAIVAEDRLRMMTDNALSLKKAKESAARTALLEAAAEADMKFHNDMFTAWLTARADSATGGAATQRCEVCGLLADNGGTFSDDHHNDAWLCRKCYRTASTGGART